MAETPTQQDLFMTDQHDKDAIPDELSPLEEAVAACYSTAELKSIYKFYLNRLFPEFCLLVSGKLPVAKLNKRQLVWMLAQVFSQKEMIESLLSFLPQGVIQVLTRLTWHKGRHSVQSFTEPLDPPFLVTDTGVRFGNPASFMSCTPDYVIVPIDRDQYYTYSSYYNKRELMLYLPDPIRNILKTYLPAPEGYYLDGLSIIEKTDFIYENTDQILNDIRLLCSYIAHGNLKYSKNGAKLLKTSAKEIIAYCHLCEFYAEKNTELEYLHTTLLVDFLRNQPVSEMSDPSKFLRKIFRLFFLKFDPINAAYRLNSLLFHVKGLYNLQYGYHEQSQRKNEQTVRASLYNLLRELSPGLWYSIDRLIDYCNYRDIDLNIVDSSFASGLLSVDIKTDSKDKYSYYQTVRISDSIYSKTIVYPFFQGFMFLMAAFGMVDIAYNLPRNEQFQRKDVPYLSVFDGLRYIRLTPLGAYIVGLTETSITAVEKENAHFLLDDKRLWIHLDGKDRIKDMILGQFSEKISDSSYKVTYDSFLKGCNTSEDIENRISLFKNKVAANPSQVWENFFNEIRDKIDPLTLKPDLLVLQLKNQPELIALMARDEVLQPYILKAEGYHVLIASQHLNKVKKRLESFGYFSHQIRPKQS